MVNEWKLGGGREKWGEEEHAAKRDKVTELRGKVKNSRARVFGELIPRYRHSFD